MALHPFDPATAAELELAVKVIRKQYPEGVELHFKAGGLEEPPKAVMKNFLAREHRGERAVLPHRWVLV